MLDFEALDSALVLAREAIKLWSRRGPILTRATSAGRVVTKRLQAAAVKDFRYCRMLPWQHWSIPVAALVSVGWLTAWCASNCTTVADAPGALVAFAGVSMLALILPVRMCRLTPRRVGHRAK